VLIISDSLDENISKITRRYSSLFTLPSHKKIVLFLCVLCLVGGVLGILPLFPSSYGFEIGLIFGITVFVATLFSDFITNLSFMQADPIFNLRRCSGLSLFSNLMWFCIIFLGSILGGVLDNWNIWAKVFFLGFCVVLVLRLVVFLTVSFANWRRTLLSSFLQPVLCVIPVLFMNSIIPYNMNTSLLFLSISIPVIILTVFFFTFFLNRVGKKALGVSSLSLFKAFLVNWTEDLNGPIEGFFEQLGSEQDIKISLLAFGAKGKMKAVVVVPALHPGPFKNVGSSLLPSMIQNTLEKKFSCVVSVPHALFGHEFDLASQVQNQKVLDAIVNITDFSPFSSQSTPFIRVERGNAKASCQVFGQCAFVTLTLAPETTEDLPPELGSIIYNEAVKQGLSSAIVVNAHNSIEDSFNLSEAIGSLKEAATTSLAKVLNHQLMPFEVGAAKIVSKEFSVKDGMGPGGITIIVTKVGDQKAAYVTIDGNNLVSGLREKILSSLNEIGVNEGEVLTTDTHTVTGITLTPRGYHPVGEAISHDKLIGYIKQATLNALEDLEPADMAWHTKTIPKVKVIGRDQIKALCRLTEKTLQRAKKLAILLFPILGIFLIVLAALA
jgi:putative membrane protein